MKKARLMFAAAGAAFLLAGCAGNSKEAFSPDRSCVYVTGEGTLKSALVLETEESADSGELEQFLEEAVLRYNEKNGGAEQENPPVALDACSAEDGVLTAVFSYRSAEDLISFRQSEENEDDSNTFASIEVKSASEAGEAGWLAGDLASPDGKTVSGLSAAKEPGAAVVRVEGGGTLVTEGDVLFASQGAVFKDKTCAELPDGQTSVVVFEAK